MILFMRRIFRKLHPIHACFQNASDRINEIIKNRRVLPDGSYIQRSYDKKVQQVVEETFRKDGRLARRSYDDGINKIEIIYDENEKVKHFWSRGKNSETHVYHEGENVIEERVDYVEKSVYKMITFPNGNSQKEYRKNNLFGQPEEIKIGYVDALNPAKTWKRTTHYFLSGAVREEKFESFCLEKWKLFDNTGNLIHYRKTEFSSDRDSFTKEAFSAYGYQKDDYCDNQLISHLTVNRDGSWRTRDYFYCSDKTLQQMVCHDGTQKIITLSDDRILTSIEKREPPQISHESICKMKELFGYQLQPCSGKKVFPIVLFQEPCPLVKKLREAVSVDRYRDS